MAGSENCPRASWPLQPREPGLGVSLSPGSQCDCTLWTSLSFCQRFSRRGLELTLCSVWEGASRPVRTAELPCVDPRGKRQGKPFVTLVLWFQNKQRKEEQQEVSPCSERRGRRRTGCLTVRGTGLPWDRPEVSLNPAVTEGATSTGGHSSRAGETEVSEHAGRRRLPFQTACRGAC